LPFSPFSDGWELLVGSPLPFPEDVQPGEEKNKEKVRKKETSGKFNFCSQNHDQCEAVMEKLRKIMQKSLRRKPFLEENFLKA